MARIYATNAIRKRNEALNFLRMSARFDAVASQISSAVTSGMVSNTMSNVVKGLEKAVQSDNVEKVSLGSPSVPKINLLTIFRLAPRRTLT